MQKAVWRAGVGVADITPEIGYELAGYAIREQGAIGIHDPVYAKALALHDGSTLTIIITCDLLGLDVSEVRELRLSISSRCGMPSPSILISATHTHSGPATMRTIGIGKRSPAYMATLKQNLLEAAIRACASLEMVRIYYSQGVVDVGVNRRGKIPPGSINPEPDPAGVVDRQVSALFIYRNREKLPWVVLMNCACHPTVLGPENRKVSADFPGAAVSYIETHFKNRAVGMFINGAAGNVNPKLTGSFNEVKAIGNRLGAEILRMAQKSNLELAVGLDAAEQEIALPFNHLPSRTEWLAWIEKYENELNGATDEAELKISRSCLEWARSYLERNRKNELPREVRVQIQRLQIGQLTIIAIPGEVFAETGIYIKSQLRYPVLVAGYANGNVGYLPPAAEIEKGGYEVLEAHKFYGNPDHFSADAEKNVRNAALSLSFQKK
ncbi:MAG: hypothetical protein D6814_04050 [Calditrichaeota bacterium]|nr:MAG: hypothetical protein D6814_04050 [Calditrichota bacterium]